ncbi:MAG TPA: OmpA family protein [Candidatus Binatia bacterium]|nr:OmpA family protein [Candidatus Binatia bacterium]
MTRSGMAAALMATLILGGCAAMRERRWGNCAIGGGLAGAALGGLGGGLGTSEIAKNPGDQERALGAGVGFVTGGVLGAVLGHLLCDPVEEAPPPPPVAAPPPPPPGTKIETLRGPEFDFDRAELKPEGRRHVDHAIEVLKANPSLQVSVEGHTDSIGSDAYNLRLSERRAETVRDYMVAQGIAASRITVRGLGKADPVASNGTAEGRAMNRRVEIIAR